MIRTQDGSPDVLPLKEVEKPVSKDGERAGKIYTASVNRVDLYSLTRTAYIALMLTGLLKPKREVLSTDFAGTQEYEL